MCFVLLNSALYCPFLLARASKFCLWHYSHYSLLWSDCYHRLIEEGCSMSCCSSSDSWGMRECQVFGRDNAVILLFFRIHPLFFVFCPLIFSSFLSSPVSPSACSSLFFLPLFVFLALPFQVCCWLYNRSFGQNVRKSKLAAQHTLHRTLLPWMCLRCGHHSQFLRTFRSIVNGGGSRRRRSALLYTALAFASVVWYFASARLPGRILWIQTRCMHE